MVDLRFYTFAPTFKVTLTIFLYTHDYVHVAEKSLYCLAIHQGWFDISLNDDYHKLLQLKGASCKGCQCFTGSSR